MGLFLQQNLNEIKKYIKNMKKDSEEIYKRSKISSFFQRLISYGAFSLNKGIIIY